MIKCSSVWGQIGTVTDGARAGLECVEGMGADLR